MLSTDAMKALVRQLLADRYQLSVHKDRRILPVYELTAQNGIAKLAPKDGTGDDPSTVGFDPKGNLKVENATMTAFAGYLQRFVLGRPVLNRTNLDGKYDLSLTWDPSATSVAPQDAASEIFKDHASSIFKAVQDELGLTLRSTKSEVEVFVVDHVALPTPN